MRSTSTPNRWITIALRATAVIAFTLAAVGVAGVANAAPVGNTAATGSMVLVKEIKNGSGVLDVYKVTGMMVTPDTASGCAGSGLRVCFQVNGSGLYVSTMLNSTYFPDPGTVNMQINGPSGVIIESGNFYQAGNDYYTLTWYHYDTVPAGYYCGTSFTYYHRDGACETVHA